jgi:hypothetical protein
MKILIIFLVILLVIGCANVDSASNIVEWFVSYLLVVIVVVILYKLSDE